MTNIGPGGVGAAGGGRPPQAPGNKPITDKIVLLNCLSQKVIDFLSKRGFAAVQFSPVYAFRESGVEYMIKLELKKGAMVTANLAIFKQSCSLTINAKAITEQEESKLVESLKEILTGEPKKLETNYYWRESGIEVLLEKYRSELQEMAAEIAPKKVTPAAPLPVPSSSSQKLINPFHRPATASASQKTPEPVLIRLTSESLVQVLQKYLASQGFLVTAARDEQLRNYPKVEIRRDKQNIATLSISQDIAWLIPAESGKQIQILIDILNRIMVGKVQRQPDKSIYWPDAKLDAMTKKLQPDLKALSETPKIDAPIPVKENGAKIGLADTQPNPVPIPAHEAPTKSIPAAVSASPTADTAPIKVEFEEAVKKWSQDQLIAWLKAKFNEFSLEEMTFSFSEGRITITVKATHRVSFKKGANEKIESNRALHFSLAVGEFGTFIRQIIPGYRDLRILQEALTKLGKSKASAMALHYVNLDMEKFKELIGTR